MRTVAILYEETGENWSKGIAIRGVFASVELARESAESDWKHADFLYSWETGSLVVCDKAWKGSGIDTGLKIKTCEVQM